MSTPTNLDAAIARLRARFGPVVVPAACALCGGQMAIEHTGTRTYVCVTAAQRSDREHVRTSRVRVTEGDADVLLVLATLTGTP